MKVNDIIVLENDVRYTLLDEVAKDDSKYFLAAGIDIDENINHKDIVILEVFREDDGDYVEIVDDKELLAELSQRIVDANK